MAVGRSPNGLVLSPDREGFVFTSPFNKDASTREAVFGKLVESKRMPVGEKSERFDWRAFFPLENRVLGFEGSKIMFMEMDAVNYTEMVRRTVPWDQLKPARDRGGEATVGEIASYRAAFKKAMLALNGTRVTGLAPIPDSWLKNNMTNYLMLTRLKKFPLLLLECSPGTPSQCAVSRGCNLENFSGSDIEKLRGIAISADRKQIFVGDPVQKKLHVLKFDSCYHIAWKGSRALPGKIKTLTNVFIDPDDRLFLTTEDPDDYLNASLFFWNKSQW
jgi:hypothetical protein